MMMSSGVSQPAGVKLLGTLVLQQRILLYLLADGRRVNRLMLGGCCL